MAENSRWGHTGDVKAGSHIFVNSWWTAGILGVMDTSPGVAALYSLYKCC